MSGYRTSSFDPNASTRVGAPMRPFNWVQWTGVAFIVVGLAIDLIYVAGRLGWIPSSIFGSGIAIALILPGIAMINSRRYPGDPAPELQRTRNQRMLLITVAVIAAVLGAAAAIQFSGA